MGGRNPAPPGMVESLEIMDKPPMNWCRFLPPTVSSASVPCEDYVLRRGSNTYSPNTERRGSQHATSLSKGYVECPLSHYTIPQIHEHRWMKIQRFQKNCCMTGDGHGARRCQVQQARRGIAMPEKKKRIRNDIAVEISQLCSHGACMCLHVLAWLVCWNNHRAMPWV